MGDLLQFPDLDGLEDVLIPDEYQPAFVALGQMLARNGVTESAFSRTTEDEEPVLIAKLTRAFWLFYKAGREEALGEMDDAS